MKKIILAVFLLFFLSGCVDVESPLIVEDGDVLPYNICNKLDEVLVISKTGCPACAVAVPILEELEEEIGEEFLHLNMAVDEDRNKLLGYGFVSKYVPTVIVDCKVYAGALEKERYRTIIEQWLVA